MEMAEVEAMAGIQPVLSLAIVRVVSSAVGPAMWILIRRS
jgi:hypothetical protein